MFRNLPSLKERVLKSRAQTTQSHGATTVTHVPLRSGPRRLWTNEAMQKAVAAVEDGGESIRLVSEKYGIPRSTLHDHISGRVEHGSKPGREPYLSPDEEEELVSFLVKCARIGYPHTRKQVMSLVQSIVNGRGVKTTISDGWWERFRQRNPKITLRVAAPLSYARAMASDRDSLNNYYDLLEETLQANEIFNDASRIFNCDETGIPLNPPSSKVVAELGAKNPSYLTGSGKAQVTVLACSCATGFVIPPLVIFDRKTLNPELTKGEVPGTLYGLSSNGWIDMELFSGWFLGHFLKYAPSCRPLLLLLDGHASHYCPDVIKMAAAERIIIFALPPNTTHLTQPLDRSCFSPLKSQWKQVVQAFVAQHRRSVSRYDFCSLFSKAWVEAMSMKTVISGFKVCGVCPFNRRALTLPEEQYTSFKPESLPRISGLKYIPMYSPMRCHDYFDCNRPNSTTQRVSTPIGHVSSSSDLFEDSLQECSPLCRQRSYSESSLYDTAALDCSATVALTPEHSRCLLTLRRATSLSNFLETPTPPSRLVAKKPKSCGRVLTSRDNIQQLKDKEAKKQAALKEKEERRELREERKRLRESTKIASKPRARKSSCLATTAEKSKTSLQGPRGAKAPSESPMGSPQTESAGKAGARKSSCLATAAKKSKTSLQGPRGAKAPSESPMGSPQTESAGKTGARKSSCLASAAEKSKTSLQGPTLLRPRGAKAPSDSPMGSPQTESAGKTGARKSSCLASAAKKSKTSLQGPTLLRPRGAKAPSDSPMGSPQTESAGKAGARKSSCLASAAKKSKTSLQGPTLLRPRGAKAPSDSPMGSPQTESAGKAGARKSSCLASATEKSKTSLQGAEATKPRTRSQKKQKHVRFEDHAARLNKSVVAAGDQLGSQNVQAKNLMFKRREMQLSGVPSEVVDVDTYSPKPPQPKPKPKKWLNNELVQLDYSHKHILLSQTAWLTDEIVNAAQRLLGKKMPTVTGFQDVVLGRTFSFNVQGDEFVQILHDGHGHWLTISTIGVNYPEVSVYDSMYPSTSTNAKNQIASLLATDHNQITLHYLDVQMQSGGYDCGLFAVAFATSLVHGEQPGHFLFDQEKMRPHLLKCLQNGDLTMFPFKKRRRIGHRVKSSDVIQVHCSCRMPELHGVDMIECSGCEEWYHIPMCVTVPSIAMDTETEWYCAQCTVS